MKKIFKHVYMWGRGKILKIKKCRFEDKTEFNLSCKFEGNNLVARCTYLANTYFGYASYVSYSSSLRDTYIGKYTCIGPNVMTAIGSHPTSKFVSIHPAFYSDGHTISLSYVDYKKFEDTKKAKGVGDSKNRYSVYIGNDVWIGASVTILDGITIGDGAVIGAGALVTEDIAPYSIVVGVPAKQIKKRFDDDEIDMLLGFRWWDKNEQWIKKHANLFEDIKRFKDKFNKQIE